MVERAGVVDEDVHRPELVHRPPNGLLDLLTLGHVTLHRGGKASHVTDFLGGRLRVDESLRARRLGDPAVSLRFLARVRLHLDVRDHDIGPRSAERQRVGTPEPA